MAASRVFDVVSKRDQGPGRLRIRRYQRAYRGDRGARSNTRSGRAADVRGDAREGMRPIRVCTNRRRYEMTDGVPLRDIVLSVDVES